MSTYEDNMDNFESEFSLEDIISEYKYEGSQQQLDDIISEVRDTDDEDAVEFDVVIADDDSDEPDFAFSFDDGIEDEAEDEVEYVEVEEEPEEVEEDEIEDEEEFSLDQVLADVSAMSLADVSAMSLDDFEEESQESEAEEPQEVEEEPEEAEAEEEFEAEVVEHEEESEAEEIFEEEEEEYEEESEEVDDEYSLENIIASVTAMSFDDFEEEEEEPEPEESEETEEADEESEIEEAPEIEDEEDETDEEPAEAEEAPEDAVPKESQEAEENVFTQSDDIASENSDYVIDKIEDSSEEYADGDIDYAEEQEKLEDKQSKSLKSRVKELNFRENVINPIIKFLAYAAMKVQQSKIIVNGAPAEEAEDLGEELPPDIAAKFYEKKVAGIRLRMRISFVLGIIMTYISLGLPVFGAMRATAVSAAVCLIMLLTVMMLGLDIMTSGIIALFSRKPNANSLIALSCLLSVIDGFIIASGATKNGLPFCAVSALTVAFSLMGSMLNCRSSRITLRAAASARKPYTVTAETSLTGDGITLLKSRHSTAGFVRRVEESGPDEIVFSTMSPYILAAALVLSLIAAIIAKNFSGFMHIFSGMVAAAVPVSILLTFPLPFFVSSKIMIHSGSSIAGWSGLYDIGKSKHIIITDNDLFPKSNVTIEKVRILDGKNPEEVISYAGSMLISSGSALAPAFTELMAKGNGSILDIDQISCHESGGLVALINGEEVYCGSSGFMQLMGVRLPNKLALKDCVYVAAGKVLCGIFEMRYTARRDVKEALASIFRTDRHPIFAVRDFNVTPQMISRKFDIPTDGFDFPAFTERYEISAAKPSDISKPAAIVAHEGLGALVQLADRGRLLCNVIRVSVLLSIICAVLGMIIMFIKMSAATASVAGLLIYMLIWLIPEIALCFFLIEK